MTREGARFWLRAFAGAIILALSLTAIGVGAIAAMLYFSANGMCGNYVAQKADAPDGKHVAYLFQRDCGATTGFSTQVSVFPKGVNLPNYPGNVFIADLRGDGPTGFWHGPVARLRWRQNHQLEIRYHHSATTHARETKRGIVAIQYVVD